MTKVERAKQIFQANAGASRAEIIALFIKELGMSNAGASTYYYNVKGSSGAPKVKATKAKTVKTKTAKPKAIKPALDAEEKAKRLELMRTVGKRFNKDMAQLKEQEQEMLSAIETDETEEDVKQYIPRFLHKELGLL